MFCPEAKNNSSKGHSMNNGLPLKHVLLILVLATAGCDGGPESAGQAVPAKDAYADFREMCPPTAHRPCWLRA